MIKLERVKKLSKVLEIGAVAIAVAGLLFRATFYWALPPEPGKLYGSGDILDFIFALALFLVCSLCAISGVAISWMGGPAEKFLAYRVALAGILSFVAYEFLHGHLPRLMPA